MKISPCIIGKFPWGVQACLCVNQTKVQVTPTPRTLWCITRCHNRLHWVREGKNRNFVHVCHSWWHFIGTSYCRHRSFTCPQLSIWWHMKKFVLEFTNASQLQVLVLLVLHKTTSWKHHHICFIQVYQTNTVQTSLRDHFLDAINSVNVVMCRIHDIVFSMRNTRQEITYVLKYMSCTIQE
jgi:hypothetical protein